MDFVERVMELIEKEGITKNKLLTSLQLGKNSFVDWSKGSKPNGETVAKIANYFGVSTDYLLTGKEDEKTSSHPLLQEALVGFDAKKAIFTEDEKDLLEAFAETLLLRREKRGE